MKKQAIETVKSDKQTGFTLMELTAALVSRRLRDACDQQFLITQTFQSSQVPTIPAATALPDNRSHSCTPIDWTDTTHLH